MARRHPLAATLSLGIVAALLVGSVGIFWQWRRAEAKSFEAQQARDQAEQEQYFSSIAAAQKFIEEGSIERAREMLLAAPPGLRHWEWGRLMLLCHREAVTLPGDSGAPQAVGLWLAAQARKAITLRHGRLRVWSLENGDFLRDLPGNDYRLAALSDDESSFASLDGQGSLQLRDTSSFLERATLQGAEPFATFALSPNGAWLAATSRSGKVTLWNAATGQKTRDIGPGADAFFTSDSRRLFFRRERSIALLEVETGREIARVEASPTDLQLICDPTGQCYARLAADGTIELGEIGRAPRLSIREKERRIVQLLFGADESRLFTLDERNWLAAWDTATGRQLQLWPERVYRIFPSPDGRLLALWGGEKFQRVLDLANDREVLRAAAGPEGSRGVFSSDRRYFGIPLPNGETKIWLLRVDRTWMQFAAPHESGTSVASRAQEIAFSPDGKTIAAGHMNRRLTLWNTADGERLATLRGHMQWILDVQFSPDGKRLASAGVDRMVLVRSTANLDEVTLLKNHGATVNALAFSPDGQLLAAGCENGELALWDLGLAARRGTFRMDSAISGLDWSPDGKTLAIGTRQALVLLDARTGAIVANGPGPVMRKVIFDPKGERLATSSPDGKITLWNARTAERIGELSGRALSLGLAFSRDSRRLFAASSERITGFGHPTVDVWDLATGRLVAEFPFESGQLSSLRLSPDGLTIAAPHTRGYLQMLEAFPWDDAEYRPAGEEARPLPAEKLRAQVAQHAAGYWRELSEIAPKPRRSGNEPGAWTPPRSYWPSRDPKAGPGLVDLTAQYNGLLNVPWQPIGLRNLVDATFEGVPVGIQRVGDTEFDIRGAVQLASNDPDWQDFFPRAVTCRIGARCRRISFLHGALGGQSVNPEIGAYRIGYADGTEAVVPLVLGRNLQASLALAREDDGIVPDAAPVFKQWRELGYMNDIDVSGAWLWLHRFDWMNPDPEKEIAAITFQSNFEAVAPFLVALSYQPAEPPPSP